MAQRLIESKTPQDSTQGAPDDKYAEGRRSSVRTCEAQLSNRKSGTAIGNMWCHRIYDPYRTYLLLGVSFINKPSNDFFVEVIACPMCGGDHELEKETNGK